MNFKMQKIENEILVSFSIYELTMLLIHSSKNKDEEKEF